MTKSQIDLNLIVKYVRCPQCNKTHKIGNKWERYVGPCICRDEYILKIFWIHHLLVNDIQKIRKKDILDIP